MTPVLACEAVRKEFGSTVVLDDLTLEIAEHDVVVLIGASGSGKSTLLRCVNLLETVDDGVIRLDGRDITDPRVDADKVRERIGIVFQAYNLFPHLSVLDNVTLAPRRVHRRARRDAEEQARAMLARVGLADKAGEYPDRLSGGQQQRVAIVRALVNDPRLLLLDEITSALDPELVGEVLALVRDLKDQGVTMMIATHEMTFARRVADRICFLDRGRILESGPPAQIFDEPSEPRTRQFLQRLTHFLQLLCRRFGLLGAGHRLRARSLDAFHRHRDLVHADRLLLARGLQRQHEYALRAALGAKPFQLCRPVLAESLLLALLGGLVGTGFAVFSDRRTARQQSDTGRSSMMLNPSRGRKPWTSELIRNSVSSTSIAKRKHG